MVRLKGHKVKLFVVTGRAHVKRKGMQETVSGLSARLAQPSVRLLNKMAHRRAVGVGQILGSFTVTVNSAGGSISSGPSRSTTASGVGLSFASAFGGGPGSPVLTILPIGPASPGLPGPVGTTTIPGLDGTQVTLPLAGSAASAGFNRGTLTGTIPLSGGISLSNGTGSASLTNAQLTLGTGTEGSSLSFEVNGGPEAKLFSVDTSQLEQSTTSNGSLDLQGLLATVSSQGAASLNTALGTDAFTTGQPVGGLTVILPATPKQ